MQFKNIHSKIKPNPHPHNNSPPPPPPKKGGGSRTYMVKKSKVASGINSCICVSNTHAYCLTPENTFFATRVNNHFYSLSFSHKE